jgi:hypothetical protein
VPDPAHNAVAVADFLQRALVGDALDVTQLEAMARAAGLLGKRQQIQHAKAFKKAKRSLGIRSVRAGFGGTGKWAWLLPAKPVKPAKEADRTRDATTCEQARSVVVNLNGLPSELLSGHVPPHWVDGIARLETHKVPRDVPAHRWRQFINDCHKFLIAKENWAERAAELGWNDLELFGCCRRPLERLGSAGLLWATNGGTLIELHRDWAVIERASDRSRHVHHRERLKAANITLPWIGLR